MSIDYCAVLLYGFEIEHPEVDESDSLDTHISRVLHGSTFDSPEVWKGDSVGYSSQGCCGERLYLCTAYHRAEDGQPTDTTIPMGIDAERYAKWDGMLNGAARALRVRPKGTPEWRLMLYAS